jgi:DHA1 family bicyclomycin/chloramphenicol resistance-like MFS transporter
MITKKPTMLTALLALAPLVMALPIAMDIYTPAIPAITQLFSVSTATMQLTLNLFMLMSGVAQLVIGPLTDRYGRRWTTFWLIIIFTLGATLCGYAQSITTLILGRLIEAIGSAGMLMLGFTIGRDLFLGEKLGQLYSMLNGIISFSPMLAPFIGSYLDLRFGWQSTFKILWVLTALSFIGYFSLLNETLPKANRSTIHLSVFKDYWHVLTFSIFNTYTLSSAIGMSYLFIFCATSPVLLIQLLHVPIAHYGFYFCFMGISFFVGSLISVAVITRLGIYKTNVLGFIVTLLGALIMLAWYRITGLTINCFIIPMLLIGMGGTFCLSAGSAGAVTPFSEHIGVASALCTAFRFLFSACIGLVIAHSITSVLPLALPALSFSLFGLVMVKKFKTSMKSVSDYNAS